MRISRGLLGILERRKAGASACAVNSASAWPSRGFGATSASSAAASHNDAAKSEPPVGWRDSADTVIIGGGINGCSVAYHLAKQSSQDVVLLEKSELTAGSTWHAAGLTATYHPGINLKRLHWYSLNLYAQIERETGQQVGLHQPGSIRLATSPVRMDEFRYQMSRQGWNQAPQFLMTPEQIKERIPIIDIDGANVLGGMCNPYDGHVDPYSLTQAIAAGARKFGARLHQRTEVTGMKMRDDATWDVHTKHGTVRAKRVVNCCGFWGREVGELCGMNLPLVPIHHQYLVTKTVPEVKALDKELPVLRHLDGSFYLRQERDGILVGPYESENTMKLCEEWARNKVPSGFGKELFPPELDRLQPHLELAMALLPCFQKAEIQSIVNGPITYTPDVLPLIGPTRVPNMWLGLGYAYGIVHGGGAGKYLADWILNGEPEFNLLECDPERYGKWTTLDYAVTKCRESYGWNNAVGYPNEERPAGRPTARVSMVHDDLVTAGAFMGFHSGWEQPDFYGINGQKPEYKPSFYRTNWHDSVLSEYETVMSRVGLIDLSPFAKFKVFGPDARAFLDYAVAGTVPTAGRTSIAHALTNGAKVYAEFTVTALQDNKFMVVTGSGAELHDLRHLEQIAREKQFRVQIDNITDEINVLSIAGPNAAKLLEAVGVPNVQDWKFLEAREAIIGAAKCLAIRISYSGELGWEFYIPKSGTRQVYTALVNKGKDFGLGHFGTFAMNTMRLEKGFKMWGNEMNLDVDILEAGLEGFVRMKKKTDFLGKSAIEQKVGVWRNQRLTMMAVESDGTRDPRGNESVWCGGRVVGNATSGCFSPALGKGLVFAYIPAMFDVAGIEVQLELMGEMRTATVLPAPPLLTQPTREKKRNN